MEARKVSILLVCHSYPPVLGGSEIEAQRVASILRARGHRVRVLCAANPEMTWHGEGRDEEGTPVRVLGSGAGRQLDWSFARGVAMRMWAERDDYDLVYFLMQGVHVAVGLAVGRWLGKKMVMKFSGSGLITPMQQSWIGRTQLRWIGRWAERVMVLNEGIEREAIAAGIGRDKLFWMPNPVDCEVFRPAPGENEKQALRNELGIAPETALVAFVGRLSPEKELGSLLGAMGELQKREPRARLVVVGDGPERAALAERAKREQLPVDLVGRQPMDRVVRYLQAADVFTLVSRLEGFPCSLVEAMAVGLPAVVSAIPANRQLVTEGEQGYLAETGDSKGIAQALERVLQDAPAAKRMGLSGRQLVEREYNREAMALRYETLFSSVLGY